MAKVLLHISGVPDKLLGHVQDNGDVDRSDPGFDDRIGHVDLRNGKVYARRFGPDKEVGRVEWDGRVFAGKLGPDDYVGRVQADGDMYRHVSHGDDDYVGSLDGAQSLLHAGAGLLLLVLPALAEEADEKPGEPKSDEG